MTLSDLIQSESIASHHLCGRLDGIVVHICEVSAGRTYGAVVTSSKAIITPFFEEPSTAKQWHTQKPSH